MDRQEGAQYAAGSDKFVPMELADGVMREGKNIGLNKIDGCASFYAVCHGTPISNMLNKVPGFNAFATLHDGWMIDLEAYKGTEMSVFETLGSMPPALLVNYGALYDKYRPLIEMEKNREKK